MLEEAIQHNTEAIIKLIEVIVQNGNCSTVAEKPKRPRRTKAEIEADKATAGETTKPAPGLDLGVEVTPSTEPEVTIETLRANGQNLVGQGGGQGGLAKAKELIAAFGVNTMDEIKPEDYAKLNAQFIEEVKNWGKSAPNTAL